MRTTLQDLAERRQRKSGPVFHGMPALLLSLRQCLLGGAAKRIAGRIKGKGQSRIYAEADGDALSWLEEGLIWMEESLQAGTPPEQALSPLAFLNARLAPADADLADRPFTGTVAGMLRKAGSVAEDALAAVDPESPGGEEIDDDELPKLEFAIDHLIADLRMLRRKVQIRAGRSRMRPVAIDGGSR